MNERELIISGMSNEELWLFRAIGGVIPYAAQARRALRSRQEQAVDLVVQGELRADAAGWERTGTAPATVEAEERKAGAA